MAFMENKIKYINLFNCINLKSIDDKAFFKNQTRYGDTSNIKTISYNVFK